MSLRGFRLATQFLTRLPVAGVKEFSPGDLSRSSIWFPLVGAIVGGLVSLTLLLTVRFGVFLSSALGVLVWVWLTGALHLDGLADLADALAASHRDPKRFLAVLADPHLGAFGGVAIFLALLMKTAALVSLAGIASHQTLAELPLIAAWARLGPLAWSRWLQPLKEGHGERFAWSIRTGWIMAWVVALLVVSAYVQPMLCLAPLALFGWGLWLKIRVGGVTGDCLGAGVEITEIALLLVSIAAAVLP